MKKWLKIEIFLIFASFFFKNFCFIPPPLKQKISNGSGHICECSYSSLGALRECIWKRYSKNFFFAKNSCFGQKNLIPLKLMITNAHQIFLNGVFKSHYSSTILEIEKKNEITCPKTQNLSKNTKFLSRILKFCNYCLQNTSKILLGELKYSKEFYVTLLKTPQKYFKIQHTKNFKSYT